MIMMMMMVRYKVCKCNPLISQIRLDFTAFELAPPFTCGGSSTSVACTTTDGPLIGNNYYMSVVTQGMVMRSMNYPYFSYIKV